ncbi:hypothetical protein [Halocatena halophila]|uniref:hypothetical protein n=1 Tax=Halocatena halophila TaxID=2814576 RepID=UPI002ED5923B
MGLGSAPAVPISDGTLTTGTFRGQCESPVAPAQSRLSHSRFLPWRGGRTLLRFWGIDRSLVLSGTVIDDGIVGVTRLWVYDRDQGSVLVDRSRLLPPFVCHVPPESLSDPMAVGRFLDSRLTIELRGRTARLSGRMGNTRLTVGFDTSDVEPVTEILGSTGDSGIEWYRVVEHRPALSLTGWLDVDGNHFRLDEEATGSLAHAYSEFDRHRPVEHREALGRSDGGPVAVVPTVDGVCFWSDGTPELRSHTEEHQSGSFPTALEYHNHHTGSHTASFGPVTYDHHHDVGIWTGEIASHSFENADLIGLTDRFDLGR